MTQASLELLLEHTQIDFNASKFPKSSPSNTVMVSTCTSNSIRIALLFVEFPRRVGDKGDLLNSTRQEYAQVTPVRF